MRKLFVCALVAMLAAGLGFASGEEETAAATMSDGGPIYGGTFALAPRWGNKPGSPDPADGNLGRTWYHELIQETPMIGDFDTYGPRRSGDFDFKLIGAIPMKYIKGNLIENWEVDQSTITWTVKRGINWAPTEVQSAWMDAREFTAEDPASDLRHWATGPDGARLLANKDANIYAQGDTVIIEFAAFDFILNATLGLSRAGFVRPPEMLEDGRIARWEDQVGTGPFMFAEYVPDQFFRMVKNPNYRGTTMVNGEDYQLPFLDEFIIPLAIDESSFEEAALRTGIADGGPSVYGTHWETLDRTAPDLIQDRLPISFGGTFAFNTEKPPFDNRAVRRALLVGTNLDDFAAQRGAKGVDLPEHWWPIYPSLASYTPQSELPPETAMLYEYDPEKAKQMLADAGYPDGFTVNFNTGNWATILQQAAIMKDQWAKMGVDFNMMGEQQETVTVPGAPDDDTLYVIGNDVEGTQVSTPKPRPQDSLQHDPSYYFELRNCAAIPVEDRPGCMQDNRDKLMGLATVIIVGQRKGSDKTGLCTGAHLGDGLILTARHCAWQGDDPDNPHRAYDNWTVYFGITNVPVANGNGILARPVYHAPSEEYRKGWDIMFLQADRMPLGYSDIFLRMNTRDPWLASADVQPIALDSFVFFSIKSDDKIRGKAHMRGGECHTMQTVATDVCTTVVRKGRQHGCDASVGSSGGPILLPHLHSMVAMHLNGIGSVDTEGEKGTSNCAISAATIKEYLEDQNLSNYLDRQSIAERIVWTEEE